MPKTTKAKKELEKALGTKVEVPMTDETKFRHIETGVETIESLIKKIKKPADKNSLKEIKSSIKLLNKKLKLM